MKPLTSEMIDIAKNAARIAAQEESKIIDRIHYIIETLYKTFDRELGYWCFPDADEGEVGNLWNHFHSYGIDVYSEGKRPIKQMSIIDKYGQEWSFEGSIPERWLFEDFEKEISAGKIHFEQMIEKKKSRAKREKEDSRLKNHQLIESVKKKLSKEELKAIKLV